MPSFDLQREHANMMARKKAVSRKYADTLILFLDVDGVLLSTSSIERFRSARVLDPDCVERLNRIVERTGAKVVISSTWRLQHMDELREALQEAGFRHLDAIVDETAHLPSQSRDSEIWAWLATFGAKAYCVLDDTRLRNRHLVRTNHLVGLTDEDVEKVLRFFGK